MSNEIRKLINLLEEAAIEDYAEVVSTAKEIMVELAEEYRNSEAVDSTSRTSTITYYHSGMIKVLQNVRIPGGYYGIDRTFKIFLQLGSNVNPASQRQMKEDFLDAMTISGYTESIPTERGTLLFGTVDGTSWGGFGLYLI